MKELLKKGLVELIGTYFLILTIGLCVFSPSRGVIPPLAIGFVLMVMVYAGGYVSGGHYNPAVSISAAIRGALPWKDLLPYWLFQIVGAVLAALTVMNMVVIPTASVDPFDVWGIIMGEFLFTFALCYVVLHTATSEKSAGNSYYGLAIGSTVMVGAFATSGICYGAFNPAVACGLWTMGAAGIQVMLITMLVNIIAGIAAGYVYKLTVNE